MRYDTEEDLKVTIEDEGALRGVKYEHPSHGMISVARYQGGNGRHFGSEIESNGGVTVTISKCQTRNDLGRNWYYDSETITKVAMNHVQYAELISNPNTQGVPCTLKYTQECGNIKYEPIETVVEHIESELEKQVSELKQQLRTLSRNVSDIVDQKGTLKKADKEKIKGLVNSVTNKVTSSIPFYEKCISETLDQKKAEARSDIESNFLHAINKLGLDVVKNPDIVRILLEDKSNGNN